MAIMISIEPRYAETDQMGVIHHSVYAMYYEMGRIRFCQSVGLPYDVIEKRGLRLALTQVTSDFMRPAYFGKTYTLTTYLVKMTRLKLYFEYVIKEDHMLVHVGRTTLAWLDQHMKPIAIEKTHPDIHEIFSKLVEPSVLSMNNHAL